MAETVIDILMFAVTVFLMLNAMRMFSKFLDYELSKPSRCKNCKWYNENVFENRCLFHNIEINPDKDYCSKSERKE